MKKLRRLTALMLVLTMVLAGGVMTAHAAASITIERDSTWTGDTSAETRDYTYYKIFDADYSEHEATNEEGSTAITDDPESPVAYSIAADDAWVEVLGSWNAETKTWTKAEGQEWFELTLSAYGTEYLVTAADGFTDNAQEAAEWLLEKAKTAGIDGTALSYNESTKKWTSGEIDEGYYLITSENSGSNLILATTDMVLHEKSRYPSIDKKQNDTAKTDDYANDAVTVQIGDTIYYELVIFVPEDADTDIKVTDTMTAGLTPAEADTVTAKTGASAGSFTDDLENGTGNANWVSALEGQVYTFTIHPTDAVKGKYVQLLLSAAVNNQAITTKDADNKNTAELEYHNYSDSDSVDFDIYKTGAVKYDGATGEVLYQETNELTAKTGKELKYLAGAEFVLTDGTNEIPVLYNGKYYYPKASEEGTAVHIISVDTAAGVVIRGLDNQKTYYLKEVKAPTGYNVLTADVELKVEQDTDGEAETTVAELYKVKIVNYAGTVLPSTGGMGTTAFYLIGTVLALGAGVLLVVRRRMNIR